MLPFFSTPGLAFTSSSPESSELELLELELESDEEESEATPVGSDSFIVSAMAASSGRTSCEWRIQFCDSSQIVYR
jgi:hypothetical protein